MIKNHSVLIILILTVCNPLFSQIQPISRESVKSNENIVANKTLRFECPINVQVGLKNISAGWKPGYGDGILVPFDNAVIIKPQQVMSCTYISKNTVIPFTIVQPFPKGYTCEFEKLPGNAQNRKFICQPIPTPPKMIPKTN